MDDEADYAILVGLLAGLVRRDPSSKRLFEMAEFRESILLREKKLIASSRSRQRRTDPLKLSEPDPAELSHWISPVGRPGGRAAIDRIRDFLAGAKRVTWCDQYLLAGAVSLTFDGPEHYAETVASVLPKSVRHLRVFAPQRPRERKKGGDPKQATQVWRHLKEGREFELIETTEIHDRYILRDGNAGLTVGGSFGGLGGKYCTILPLPRDDVSMLYRILDDIASPHKHSLLARSS